MRYRNTDFISNAIVRFVLLATATVVGNVSKVFKEVKYSTIHFGIF